MWQCLGAHRAAGAHSCGAAHASGLRAAGAACSSPHALPALQVEKRSTAPGVPSALWVPSVPCRLALARQAATCALAAERRRVNPGMACMAPCSPAHVELCSCKSYGPDCCTLQEGSESFRSAHLHGGARLCLLADVRDGGGELLQIVLRQTLAIRPMFAELIPSCSSSYSGVLVSPAACRGINWCLRLLHLVLLHSMGSTLDIYWRSPIWCHCWCTTTSSFGPWKPMRGHTTGR